MRALDPRWAAGAAARARGFTLIELLVVLIIVGVVLSFAMLSLRGDGQARRIGEETRRLAAVLALAGQEAVLQSREMGVRFSPNGYRFYTFGDDAQWQPIEDEPAFRARTLTEGLQLELHVEGMPMTMEREADSDPQVLLLSSGELTSFEVWLRPIHGGEGERVSGYANGRLETTLARTANSDY
jgi:general secretion pathway protein H